MTVWIAGLGRVHANHGQKIAVGQFGDIEFFGWAHVPVVPDQQRIGPRFAPVV
jgi:hypothetical protein